VRVHPAFGPRCSAYVIVNAFDDSVHPTRLLGVVFHVRTEERHRYTCLGAVSRELALVLSSIEGVPYDRLERKRVDPVKRTQVFAACTVAFVFATVGVGCQDEAAIKALGELTDNLAKTADEQQAQLTTLSGQIETCKADLAKVSKKATVIEQAGGVIDIPTLSGDRNLVTLEAHKLALNETIDKQKARIGELDADNEKCAEELTQARRKVRAQKRKPEAVKRREAQGEPTTGAASRYKKR